MLTRNPLWLWISLPVAVHAVLLYAFATNAPRLDDFSEVLSFLPNFYAADNWRDKLHIYFAVYQDHRYGLTHALNLLTDGINFRQYVLWGNLILPAYLWLFWRALHAHPLQKTLTAIAALLIFNLQAWYGMYWASILLTSLGSLPIALATFLLLCASNSRAQPYAFLAALCLTYTLGNGVLVWPLAVCFSLMDNYRQQKKLWDHRSLLWLIAGIVVLTLYFHDFHFLNKEGAGGGSFFALLQHALQSAPRIVIGYFCLAGSHLLYYSGSNDWRIIVACIIGIIETLALGWLLWHQALRTRPTLLLLLAFTALTMLSIAVARAATINLGQTLQGHYKLYTATYLLILIVAALDWIQHNKPQYLQRAAHCCLLSSATLYIAGLWLFVPMAQHYQQTLAADMRQWLYNNTLKNAETRLFVKQPNKKLMRAIEDNFYNPWTLLSAQQLPTTRETVPTCTATAALPATIESHKAALAVHIRLNSDKSHETFLLCSPQQTIRFSVQATHYQHNENGTYNLELWVPRLSTVQEDAGPWALYAQP